MTRFLPLLFLSGLLSVVPGCVSAERRRIRAMPSYVCGAPSEAEMVSVGPRTGTGLRGFPRHCVVCGTVWDAEDTDSLIPLRNAAVRLMDTKRVAVTDSAGMYRLDRIPPGPVSLEVSYMGYNCLNVELRLHPGDSAVVNFKMTYQRLDP